MEASAGYQSQLKIDKYAVLIIHVDRNPTSFINTSTVGSYRMVSEVYFLVELCESLNAIILANFVVALNHSLQINRQIAQNSNRQ